MQRSKVTAPDFEQYLNAHPEYRGWNPEKDHNEWKPEYRMMAPLYCPSTSSGWAARDQTSTSGQTSSDLRVLSKSQISMANVPATPSNPRRRKARAVDNEDGTIVPSGAPKNSNLAKGAPSPVQGQNSTSTLSLYSRTRAASPWADELQMFIPTPSMKKMQQKKREDTLSGALRARSGSISQGQATPSNATPTGAGPSGVNWMHPRTGRIHGHWYRLPVSTLASLEYIPNACIESVADPTFLPPMNRGDWVQFQVSQVVELDGFQWILPAACPVQFVSPANVETFASWQPTI